jgi:hypothetical protein
MRETCTVAERWMRTNFFGYKRISRAVNGFSKQKTFVPDVQVRIITHGFNPIDLVREYKRYAVSSTHGKPFHVWLRAITRVLIDQTTQPYLDRIRSL